MIFRILSGIEQAVTNHLADKSPERYPDTPLNHLQGPVARMVDGVSANAFDPRLRGDKILLWSSPTKSLKSCWVSGP